MPRLISIAAVVAVLLALGGAASPHEARAQTPGGVYEGFTEDGRLIRLVVSDDGTAVSLVDASEPPGTTCPGGHIERFFAVPIPLTADGQFEADLPVDQGGLLAEPTGLATGFVISGEFAAAGTVAGTFRALRTEDPSCDSGIIAWSGNFLFPEGSIVRQGGVTFTGGVPEGPGIEFSLSPDRDFITSLRVGNVQYEDQDCPWIASSLPVVERTGVDAGWSPVPIEEGRFSRLRTVIVADPMPAWTMLVEGTLVSETEADGTLRVVGVDRPECDTGVLAWTATAPTPPPAPSPSAGDGIGGGGPGGFPAGGGEPPAGGGPWSPLGLALAGVAVIGALAAGWSFRSRR